MAEGTFRRLADEAGMTDSVEIDSAATGPWHLGDTPDTRAQAASLSRGIDISGQRARQVSASDFDEYDYILAMDNMNYGDLMEMSPAEHRDKIHLYLSFGPSTGITEVPDPYYGGDEGFERVLDLVTDAGRGLLKEIKNSDSE